MNFLWQQSIVGDCWCMTTPPKFNCLPLKSYSLTLLGKPDRKGTKHQCSEPLNFGGVNYVNIWVFPKIVVPQNGWFIMENPIKIGDLGVPLFSETPISNTCVVVLCVLWCWHLFGEDSRLEWQANHWDGWVNHQIECQKFTLLNLTEKIPKRAIFAKSCRFIKP